MQKAAAPIAPPDPQAAFFEFCERVYLYAAYVHAVGEGEALALLLMQRDNAVGVPHISDKHRGALEAAVSRWPSELTQPLAEALGQAALLYLDVQLGDEAALLKAPEFCRELRRLDRGDRTVVRATDDALITMHSWLANRSRALALLQPLADAHDAHLAHLERMERRLDRLHRL